MARDAAETDVELPPLDLDATDAAGKLWLTRQQAAAAVNSHPDTIRRWTRLYGHRIGRRLPSGRWYYYRRALAQ